MVATGFRWCGRRRRGGMYMSVVIFDLSADAAGGWREGLREGGGRTAGARQGFRFGGMSYRQAMVWDRGIPGLLRKLNFLH
jgi:hypothetical protein